jgi:L-iditol 2-dehydrogenase
VVQRILFIGRSSGLDFGVVTIPKTMRAVVYRGANDLRVELIPVPRIGAGEILVKVAVCGVCPTDIKKIQYGTVSPPRVFGHETAGTVVKIGAMVRRFKVGDRVALHHHVPCLECHACRHTAFAQCAQYKSTGITAGFEPAGGGYAEYVRVMPFVLPGVVKIPARNTFVEGAMLEPVNTVLKAIKRLNLLRGDTVLVAGQGPIGLMFTRLLALRGISVLATDLLPTRLREAAELGAKEVFQVQGTQPVVAGRRGNSQSGDSITKMRPRWRRDLDLPSLVQRMTRGRGLDAAIIAVPSAFVVREAQALVRGGGQVLLFSHTKRGEQGQMDLATICVDEKDLIGSYSADFTLQAEVAGLIFSRRMDARRLITHEFPLEKTADAVKLAAHPTVESLKVVVNQEVQVLIAKGASPSLSCGE